MSLFIFDLGKVLVHGLDTTASLRGGDGFDSRELYADYRLYERALMDGFMKEEDYYAHLRMSFGEEVAAALSSPPSALVPDESLLSIARKLRGNGHVCVIGSNTIDSHWKATPDGIFCCFDRGYPSYIIHRSKPEPCFFSYICDEEGFPPSDTYLIDDRKENVDAAESLGIRTLHYKGDDLGMRTERFFRPFLQPSEGAIQD